jgi:GTP-binding protein EngB required for normal cell division
LFAYFNEYFTNDSKAHFELLVNGCTNAGKSTTLSNLTRMRGLLNTSEANETFCIWNYIITGPDDKNYTI